MVLSFSCAREIAEARFLNRKLATRTDGTVEMFRQRCDEFERNNPGILSRYEDRVFEVRQTVSLRMDLLWMILI